MCYNRKERIDSMNNKKYIIVELIPTALNPKRGEVVQLSALKIEGLTLKDRFDYRLEPTKIYNSDIVKMISYDKDNFKYVKNSKKILQKFKKWVEDYDLLMTSGLYEKLAENIPNKKESVFAYLNMTFSDDIIDKIIKKYQLVPSNHIVDLLYEAIIYENNSK